MNRGLRRDITMKKYISRIKKRLYKIRILDGFIINRNGYRHYLKRKPINWKDADENCPWVKRLKHNKVYGRSTTNVLEKHFKIKQIRKESKDLTNNVQYYKNRSGKIIEREKVEYI